MRSKVLLLLCWITFTAGCSERDERASAAEAAPTRRQADNASDGRPSPAAADDGLEVYFSPDGGCTDAIVHEIGQAKLTVHVQASDLTYERIAVALREAHQRGVKVVVVLDESQREERKAETGLLTSAGIPVHFDDRHKTAHNKVIIVDGQAVITGSFNFTKESENSKAENLLIVRDKPAVTAAYERNFQEHLAHSDGPEK
jgi:phosphatidylserine/phosphatidylglycerophosphate/cardiolipin synthase-like enzyme